MLPINREHTLVRAIESVVKQDFTNWELLIVDDGSFDNTSHLIGKYQDKHQIKYFQLCLGNTKGAWIVTLDSDNTLTNGSLKKINNAIKEHPNILFHNCCVHSFSGVLMGYQQSKSIVASGADYLCEKYWGEHQCVIKK